MLSVRQARARIIDTLPAPTVETIDLHAAAGRVLAQDIVAARLLPPWDNSAMDGVAVRAEDLPGTLTVIGMIAAGDAPTQVVGPGEAVRIMTGAPTPAGANAVVMREEVDDQGETISIAFRPDTGAHIRRAGEDINIGDRALTAGTLLGAGELGLLAALGVAQVPVYRRPRIAILSTGDELVPVTTTPGPGQIVSSNAHALAAQLREAGAEPVDLGIVADQREAIAAAIGRGLSCDALVSSGGVSVGDFDFVKEAFADCGVTLDFWKVAMKPGKPLAFGIGPKGVPVFGLPGNPVSSMVVFELLVRPAVCAMVGARDRERPLVPVVLPDGYDKPEGRAHYVRASVRRNGATLTATPHRKQGSGMLTSMIGVDALVEIDREVTHIAPGATAPALLLRSL